MQKAKHENLTKYGTDRFVPAIHTYPNSLFVKYYLCRNLSSRKLDFHLY